MRELKVLASGMFLFVLLLPTVASADIKSVPKTDETIQRSSPRPGEEVSSSSPSGSAQTASLQTFQLNWISINGGGAINAASTSYQLGLSVGQSVAGAASSPSYQMGIGFWYGAGAPACAAARGDINGIGGLTAADVVLILNCAFLGNGSGTVDGTCNSCFTDVNCDTNLTAADVVLELNRVFLGQTAPPWCGA